MATVRVLLFASIAVVVGCSSSSGDSGGSTSDSGSAYDGPFADIVTGRPDDGVDSVADTALEADAVAETGVESGADADAASETAAETSTDAGGDALGDVPAD